MTDTTLAVTLPIPKDRIYSLIITANESGAGYWARIVDEHLPKEAALSWLFADDMRDGKPLWPHHVAPLAGGSVTYGVHDGDGKVGRERYTLTAETIARGLRVMATKYGVHFGNFMSENEDAETGDVFLQCCLFGDVLYG